MKLPKFYLAILHLTLPATLCLYTASAWAWGSTSTMPVMETANSNNGSLAASGGNSKLHTMSVEINDTTAAATISRINAQNIVSDSPARKAMSDLTNIITSKNISLNIKTDAVTAFINVCGSSQTADAGSVYQICTDKTVDNSLKITLNRALMPSVENLYPNLDTHEKRLLLASLINPIKSDATYRSEVETLLTNIGLLTKTNSKIWQDYGILVHKATGDVTTEISLIAETLAIFPEHLRPKEGLLLWSSDTNFMESAGRYNPGIITMNSDVLNTGTTQHGEFRYQLFLNHELGHYVYHNILNDAQRSEWETFFANSFSGGKLNAQDSMMPEDAEKTASEDFAYNFAVYLTSTRSLTEAAIKEMNNETDTIVGSMPLIEKTGFISDLLLHIQTLITKAEVNVNTYVYGTDSSTEKISRYDAKITKIHVNGQEISWPDFNSVRLLNNAHY